MRVASLELPPEPLPDQGGLAEAPPGDDADGAGGKGSGGGGFAGFLGKDALPGGVQLGEFRFSSHEARLQGRGGVVEEGGEGGGGVTECYGGGWPRWWRGRRFRDRGCGEPDDHGLAGFDGILLELGRQVHGPIHIDLQEDRLAQAGDPLELEMAGVGLAEEPPIVGQTPAHEVNLAFGGRLAVHGHRAVYVHGRGWGGWCGGKITPSPQAQ